MNTQDRRLGATVWLLGATLAVSALFVAIPALDLWVAAQFWDEGRGTWRGNVPAFVLLRDIARTSTYLVATAALFMMVAAFVLRGAMASGWRVWAFLVSTVLVGPGLIVNGFLKSQSGRARPANLSEFGGSSEFTPAYQFTDQCLQNCSFVSGEASMMAAVAIPLLALSMPQLSSPGRWLAVSTGVMAMAGTGMLRVMKGRHFLSDVVLAVLFTALVALLLYWLFDIARARSGFRLKLILRDLRLIVTRLCAPANRLIGGSGAAGPIHSATRVKSGGTPRSDHDEAR